MSHAASTWSDGAVRWSLTDWRPNARGVHKSHQRYLTPSASVYAWARKPIWVDLHRATPFAKSGSTADQVHNIRRFDAVIHWLSWGGW
jgi:hypothetical protein